MGLVNCCLLRDLDETKRARTRMVLDYLNRNECPGGETKTPGGVQEYYLSDEDIEFAESLDKTSQKSV
jgi:hypothetical protein